MSAFTINAYNLHWLNDPVNDPQDICLHGHARAVIGSRIIECDCTISSAALYLLKSLTEDHIPARGIQQLLPCCGFSYLPNEALDQVEIVGCDDGEDWTILHEGDSVRLILADGTAEIVDIGDYRAEVLRFVDKIEAYYKACPPKILPTDSFESDGYTAFWNEWNRRKNA